jgi:D-alanine--poly(phosphoribitol) ligase subunit 2
MRDHFVRVGIDSILKDRLRMTVPTPTTDLLETGLLDSMGLVELIAAIEQRFEVVINLMDLDLDQVRTVPAIYSLVDGVLAAQRPTAPSARLVSTAAAQPVNTLDGAA